MKKIALPILLILFGCIVPTICMVKSIKFQQDCSGYLKQAADANTVEIALERIDKAIGYIEVNGLVDGYTSILWKTEDENIGFWCVNIKACRDELQECLDGTQLEKSNVLMKVRESLTDNDDGGGTVLTIPDGISRYPYNWLYAVLNTISLLVIAFGLVWILVLGDFIDFNY